MYGRDNEGLWWSEIIAEYRGLRLWVSKKGGKSLWNIFKCREFRAWCERPKWYVMNYQVAVAPWKVLLVGLFFPPLMSASTGRQPLPAPLLLCSRSAGVYLTEKFKENILYKFTSPLFSFSNIPNFALSLLGWSHCILCQSSAASVLVGKSVMFLGSGLRYMSDSNSN